MDGIQSVFLKLVVANQHNLNQFVNVLRQIINRVKEGCQYKWESNNCRSARYSACNILLENCVTNGTKCVDGTNCAAQFKGTQSTCQAFTANCNDSYLTYDNDQDCESYLTGCVTKRTGCIIDTAQCSSYSGTPEERDKFKGNKTTRFWNTTLLVLVLIKHVLKQVVRLMTQLVKNFQLMEMEVLQMEVLYALLIQVMQPLVQTLKEIMELINVFKVQVESVEINNVVMIQQVKLRELAIHFYQIVLPKEHDAFSRHHYVPHIKEQLKNVQPLLEIQGINAQDQKPVYQRVLHAVHEQEQKMMIVYHMMLMQSQAAVYHIHLLLLKKLISSLCSYSTSATGTYSAGACNLWVSTLTNISCENYNGQASCKLNGTVYCYAPQCVFGSYTIPSGTTDKVGWCNAMFTNAATPTKCSYDATWSTTVYSTIDTCEEIISPTNAADCNKKLNNGTCQFVNSKCITTKTACTSYLLAGMTSGQVFSFEFRCFRTCCQTMCIYFCYINNYLC